MVLSATVVTAQPHVEAMEREMFGGMQATKWMWAQRLASASSDEPTVIPASSVSRSGITVWRGRRLSRPTTSRLGADQVDAPRITGRSPSIIRYFLHRTLEADLIAGNQVRGAGRRAALGHRHRDGDGGPARQGSGTSTLSLGTFGAICVSPDQSARPTPVA